MTLRRTFIRLQRILGDYWQPVFLSILALVTITVIYLFKLGSLTRGVTQTELALRERIDAQSLTFIDLLRSAENLVFRSGEYLLQFLPFRGAGSIRLLSVVITLTAIVGFYYIVRHWFTARLSLLATTLFATSAWLLHVGRYGDAASSYLLLVVAIAGWLWVQAHRESRLALPLFGIVLGATLYVPGMILLLLPLVIWQRKTIHRMIKQTTLPTLGLAGLTSLVLATPLLLTIFWPLDNRSQLDAVSALAGIPGGLPSAEAFFNNLLSIPVQLFAHHDIFPQYGIIGLPLIDFFTTVMFVIGVLVCVRDWRLDRSVLLMYLLLAGWLLVAVMGMATMIILLPIIYLFAAIGLAFMLVEWLSVFPRNPLARWLGISLAALAVLLVATYNLRSYFVAWPFTQATKDAYSRRIDL